MTDERLEELRALCQREYGVSPSIACEMLDELDRLRGAAEGLEAWLTCMDSESEGLQFAQCDEKGRELGLWK